MEVKNKNKTKQEERSVCVCIPAEGQSADVCLVWTSSGFAVAAAAAVVVAAAAGGGADKPEWTLKKMQKDVRSQHKEKRIKSNIFGSSLYKPEKKEKKFASRPVLGHILFCILHTAKVFEWILRFQCYNKKN